MMERWSSFVGPRGAGIGRVELCLGFVGRPDMCGGAAGWRSCWGM